MKILLRILLGLFLLLVLLVGAGIYYIDYAVKSVIEEGGTYALGVETRLESADLELFAGRCTLDGLTVANPAGFAGEHFAFLGRGPLEVDIQTLSEPMLVVPSLQIEGFELLLERKGTSTNVSKILANLERLSGPEEEGGEGGGTKEPAEGPEKTYLVRSIVLRDITATADLVPEGGELAKTSVTIERLELEDIGDTGETLPQLVLRITRAVLDSAVGRLEGQIPVALLQDLQADLSALEDEARAKLDEKVRELGEDVKGKVDDAVQKGLDDLLKRD